MAKKQFKPDLPIDSSFEYLPIHHVLYGSQVVSEGLVPFVVHALPKVHLAVLGNVPKFRAARPRKQRKIDSPGGG